MKALILLLVMFAIAQYGFAEVVKPSNDMLESDLNFQHNDSVTKTEQTESEKNKNPKESERDVASDIKDTKKSSTVQFWDY